MAMNKLVYYIIPLIVLVLLAWWQFGGEGLLEGVKGAVKGVIAMAPNITVGAGELTGEKPTIPKEHEEAIRKLVGTIEEMVKSEEKNCFRNYKIKDYKDGGLPNLGEKGTAIELSEDRIIITTLGGKQIVTDLSRELGEKMKGFKPCVIAGENKEVARNFYEFIIKKETKREHYSTPVENIRIYSDGANRIVVGIKEVDKERKNFKDGGWLFSPGEGWVCFFPTEDGGRCKYEDYGLKNNCFKGGKISEGCLGEGTEDKIESEKAEPRVGPSPRPAVR